MCTYGIGLPFDHPIWQNLPPCRCGGGNSHTVIDAPWTPTFVSPARVGDHRDGCHAAGLPPGLSCDCAPRRDETPDKAKRPKRRKRYEAPTR